MVLSFSCLGGFEYWYDLLTSHKIYSDLLFLYDSLLVGCVFHFNLVIQFFALQLFTVFFHNPFHFCQIGNNVSSFMSDFSWAFFYSLSLAKGLLILLIFPKNQALIVTFLLALSFRTWTPIVVVVVVICMLLLLLSVWPNRAKMPVTHLMLVRYLQNLKFKNFPKHHSKS